MIAERLNSRLNAGTAWIRAMPARQFRAALIVICGIAVVAAVLLGDRQSRKASREIASLKSDLTAARAALAASVKDPAKQSEPVKAASVPAKLAMNV